MNARQAALSRRRAVLVGEIDAQRDAMAEVFVQLRTQLALAGLAMLAARLLRRSRWLRLLTAGGAVLVAALPLLARLLPDRR
jgi:hypothetical protein